LTPSLALDSLRKKTEKYKSDLEKSQPTQAST